MKEFMMIFWNDKNNPKPSPEEMQDAIKMWQNWIGGIAAQGKLVATNALGPQGKTVMQNNVITDGPYAEVKEMIGGYLIAKTTDLEDAIKLTEGCPSLSSGGKVEVREVMVIPEM
jgi:hypothetical protein